MSWIRGALVVALLPSLMSASVSAEESMRILTYPLGLVVGELEVASDLGAGVRSADLFLDGQKACSLTADATECTVDLGPEPHVHLLELIGSDGRRAERWLNRPGEEAELDLVLTPPSGPSCGARLGWAHPERQDPIVLEVTLDGNPLAVEGDGRSVSFLCPPESDAAHALIASASFADGRRVETVALVGGFSGRTEVALTALPLVADREPAPPCEAGASGWPLTADRIERGGFQVVFVLDPKARIGGSFSAGGSPGNRLKAPRTLAEADQLWYVLPNEDLHRVNGLTEEGWRGDQWWLSLLFRLGNVSVPRPHRIADAVAASALLAGTGGNRRAVVLVLGKDVAERDESLLTPAQAREYLAEVGVPLVVLRHGKRGDDGWPKGLVANNMDDLADSLQQVRQLLDRQCIAWFGAELNPRRVADLMPEGVRLAGRGGDAPRSPEAVWSRVELEATAETTGATAGPIAGERIDVTAITVLVNAVDGENQPVRDLELDDLELLENGVAVDVQALTPVVSQSRIGGEIAAPELGTGLDQASELEALPVTVFVDRTLAGGGALRSAVRIVAALADRLAALGPVEVVVGEQEAKTLVGPTTDVPLLVAALEVAAKDLSPRQTIERLRFDFLRGLKNTAGKTTFRIAAIQAAGEEHRMVMRSLDRLSDWNESQTEHRAGLLVLVGTGFDEDPARFYVPFIEQQDPEAAAILREDLRKWHQEGNVNALGRRLAASGWRVLSVSGGGSGIGGWADSAEQGGQAKVRRFKSATVGGSFGSSTPDFLLVAPLDSLRHLALPSGGDLVVSKDRLRTALDGAAGWYRLTYEVSRAPDDRIRDLQIESQRPGTRLTTAQAVVDVTPERRMSRQVLELLGPSPAAGELPLSLRVGAYRMEDDGRLTARVDAMIDLEALGSAIPGGGARLRISIAVAPHRGEPTVVDRQEELAELPASGEWVYTFPVQWPQGDARIAVMIQDRVTGLWGGTVTDLPAAPRKP